MRCCIVNSCCFMRLHTAGKVIAWLGVAWCILKCILLVGLLCRMPFIPDNDTEGQTSENYDKQVLKAKITLGLSLALGISIVDLVASVLLFIGIKKNSHVLLLPWLIDNAISIVFNFLFFSLVVFVELKNSINFGPIVFYVILLGIHVLICSAIYSLFRLIRSEKEQKKAVGCERASPGDGFQYQLQIDLAR